MVKTTTITWLQMLTSELSNFGKHILNDFFRHLVRLRMCTLFGLCGVQLLTEYVRQH